MKQNTPRQKKNCLRNFDLSEHRQILSDLAIHIYHQFITVMEKALTPAIGISLTHHTSLPHDQPEDLDHDALCFCPTVPGMLVHESLQGISSMKPTGFRKRSNSTYEEAETSTISSILQELSVFHSTMSHHGMEQGLIRQAVKQLFFLVGATTFNSIMLRKDMCSCRKGMQIRLVLLFEITEEMLDFCDSKIDIKLLCSSRCNISYLEEWLKEKGLQSSNAIDTLRPLSQAAWLLQVNKSTDDDAREINEKCTELNPVQVIHSVLHLALLHFSF